MTQIYLRPTAFVDAPFGRDGQVLRLTGGMTWCSAIEIIRVEGGKRVSEELVPIERLDQALGALSGAEKGGAEAILARLTAPRAALQLGERIIRLDQPQVMAILNITPDSFSDGGRHFDDADASCAAGVAMASSGAAIIDVGGESTRPGAVTVWEGDEIVRVVPVIERLARAGVAISVDTRKAATMEAALVAGAHLVNDVSGLTYDPQALSVVARAGCPVVLMHHKGDPATMQADPQYQDVLIEVYDWLEMRVEACVAAGIARDRIVIDPGIGFGKSVAHNLALLNGLALFHGIGCPLLLGVSRKRIIGALDNEAPVERRLGGSIAMATLALTQGAQLLRVHDVAESVQAIKVWRGMRDRALTPNL